MSGSTSRFAVKTIEFIKHLPHDVFISLVAIYRALVKMTSSEASLLCAGVAFFGFISMFPALVTMVILFGFFIDQSLVDEIIAYADPFLPEGPETLLKNQLYSLLNQQKSDLSVGLLISLSAGMWSGSRGMNAFSFALTRAYHQEDKRGFLYKLMISLTLTIGSYLILMIALFSIAIIPFILSFIPPEIDTFDWLLWLRWPIMACMILIGTIMLYWLAPDRQGKSWSLRWLWLVPGAIAATLLWSGASYLFSMYVENFSSYDATFGSVAAVIVLLLWTYYTVMIFVFGAALNAELKKIFEEEH